MKKVKKFFNSMYARFIIIFIIILMLSNFMAFIITSSTQLGQMREIRDMLIDLPNSSQVFEQVAHTLRANMFLSTVISSTFIVIILYVILRPIKRISNATKVIANGDFNVEVKEKGKDEVGELVKNFNKMANSLKNNEYLHKDFVSSVSHEIKTPITAISGYAKLLKDDDISEKQKNEYIDIIVDESKRLTNLSTNLLKLSELDNKIIYTKREFSLDEQIRRVVLLLQNKWEEKNIEIDADIEKVKYLGDEELFELVWINLINNAIKFTSKNGKIHIKLKEINNEINVSIQDTGIGIDEKNKQYIFERFYIVDKSRNKESTGLGLSIVKKIIALSEGEISFESQKGIGTTFHIKLIKN